jgi:hypothetical protein
MKFNTDECKVMHIGANNLEAEYFMEEKQLEKITEAAISRYLSNV